MDADSVHQQQVLMGNLAHEAGCFEEWLKKKPPDFIPNDVELQRAVNNYWVFIIICDYELHLKW